MFLPVVVVPPVICKLLKLVNTEAGSVFVEVSFIVPAPGVKVEFDEAIIIEVHAKTPPFVISIAPLRLLLPDWPNVVEPETTKTELLLNVRVAIALVVGDKRSEEHTAVDVFTVTD